MSKLARSAVWVVVLMLASKALGLLKEVIIANQFGTSYIVDAYNIACSLPTIMFTILASGFSSAYLPVYVRVDGEDKKRRFFCNTVTALTLISLVLTAICIIFSKQFVSILAPGFDLETASLASGFIKVVAWFLPFYTAFNIFTAHMQAKEDFTAALFYDYIVCNVVLIVFFLIATPSAPYLLVIGYVISMAIATIGSYIYMTRKKYIRYRPMLYVKDDSLKTFVAIAIPAGLSSTIGQVNAMIDRIFSTNLGVGVTSALSYAHRIEVLPNTFIASVFLSLCKPRMNVCFANGDNEGAMTYAKRAFMTVMYASIPIVLAFVLFSTPVVRLLLERGEFDSESTKMTAACLIFYSLGLPFSGINAVLSTVLAAICKQKWLFYNTIFTVFANVGLNFLFANVMGYRGLALATSFSVVISCIIKFAMLKKLKLKLFDTSQFCDLTKVVLCTVFSIMPVWVGFEFLKAIVDERLLVIVCAIVAIPIYLALGILFNVQILKWMYNNVPSRFKIIKKWNNQSAV